MVEATVADWFDGAVKDGSEGEDARCSGLSHLISVQFYCDFFVIYVPFSLLYFILFMFVYNLCYVIVFWCVSVCLLCSWLGIFLCH